MTWGYRRVGADIVLLNTTLVLVAVGVVMVFNSSLQRPMDSGQNGLMYLYRQGACGLAGLVAMWWTMRAPYTWLSRYSSVLLSLSLALLLAVYLPVVGIRDNGAARWVGRGSLRIQPSEITKLTLILYLAALLSRNRYDIRDLWNGAFAPMFTVGVCALLVEAEPDLGTALVILLTGFTVLYLGGAQLKHIAGMLSAAVLLVLIAALRHPYRLERIRTFLDPARDPTGTTYQVIQGIRAVGSGWITGLGFGQGRGKFYLPAANTDYIFATLAEELGFIGSVLLIALFVVLGYRAFVIARCAPDRFGTLTAAGIGAWFTSQSLLNMLVVTGAAPATGVPLPFVSYGGSSLVVALIGIGVLLNISQYRSERPSGAGPIRT